MAAPEYEKYLNLYPSASMLYRESALFRLGECYRKIGNVNAAKNAYQTLLLNYAIGQFDTAPRPIASRTCIMPKRTTKAH